MKWWRQARYPTPVTPNAAIGATGTATLAVSGGGTLGTTTLNFTAGSSASQSTTLTRSTDGTSTLTLTNNMGLSNGGSPATFTSTTPAVPDIETDSYRTSASALFADVAAATAVVAGSSGPWATAARVGVTAPADEYTWGVWGPTYNHVEASSEWAWANPGGDWINTAGTAQATTLPHWTTSTTSTGTVSGITATAGAVAAWVRGRGNAYIVKATGGVPAIAALHHPTAAAPIMLVTYSDGTSETLACSACVQLVSGTAYSQIGAQSATVSASVALEFSMPSKAVASATITLAVTSHPGGTVTLNGYLANPPTNAEAVAEGIAVDYPADDGIDADSSVVFAQNYADGSTLSDWVIPYSTLTVDMTSKANWSPGVYGGTTNSALLPTAYGGVAVAASNKWFHKQDSTANVSLVSSSYTSENFSPRATGLGALRIVIPGSTAVDGANVGQGGGFGCDLMTLLPEADIGNPSSGNVRFSIRFAWVPKALADTKMYRTGSGGSAFYAVPIGKMGIGWHHYTKGGSGSSPQWDGGSNNDGGENLGWSARLGYVAAPADAELISLRPFVHSQDMRPDHENLNMGNVSGLGSSMYPDTWYDIETELTLNTYNNSGAVGTSSADGSMSVYINGRLDSTHTGFKWRDGAIDYAVTPNGPYLAPFRELGLKGLWMNFYNGGVQQQDMDLVFFVTGVVATV